MKPCEIGDLIGDARRIGDRYAAAVQHSNKKLDLKLFNDEFQEAYKHFKYLKAAMPNLLACGLVSQEQAALQQAARLYIQVKTRFTSGSYDLEMARLLRSELKKSVDTVNEIWNRHVTGRIGGIEDVMKWFATMNIQNPRQQQMEQKRRFIRARPAGDSEALKVIDEYIAMAEIYFAESSINDAVKRSVKQLALGTATLLDLDIEAIRWLQEKGYARRVKLSIQ